MIRSIKWSPSRVGGGAVFLLVVSLAPTYAFGGYANVSAMFLSHNLIATAKAAEVTSRAVPVAERASASMVGAVMALLATFEDAEVLPPEGTAQANQLIHGLIQLQSALMKSTSSELRDYVVAAWHYWLRISGESAGGSLHDDGLTSAVLASLIVYAQERPLWDETQIVAALQAYNFTRQDWALIVTIYTRAEDVFRVKGDSIHRRYDQWRLQMPGR